MGNLGSLPVATPAAAAGMRKSWHEDITQDLRNHLVHKLYAFHNYLSVVYIYWGEQIIKMDEQADFIEPVRKIVTAAQSAVNEE